MGTKTMKFLSVYILVVLISLVCMAEDVRTEKKEAKHAFFVNGEKSDLHVEYLSIGRKKLPIIQLGNCKVFIDGLGKYHFAKETGDKLNRYYLLSNSGPNRLIALEFYKGANVGGELKKYPVHFLKGLRGFYAEANDVSGSDLNDIPWEKCFLKLGGNSKSHLTKLPKDLAFFQGGQLILNAKEMAKYNNLKFLKLENLKFDLSWLKNKNKLTSLTLKNCEITNADQKLPAMPELAFLNLESSKFDKTSLDISTHNKLQEIDLEYCGLEKITGLKNKTALTTINVLGSKLVSLPVVKIPSLKKLVTTGTQISAKFLADFSKLNPQCTTARNYTILLKQATKNIVEFEVHKYNDSSTAGSIFRMTNAKKVKALLDCFELGKLKIATNRQLAISEGSDYRFIMITADGERTEAAVRSYSELHWKTIPGHFCSVDEMKFARWVVKNNMDLWYFQDQQTDIRETTRESEDISLRWFKANQNADGSWGKSKQHKSIITALTLATFMQHGETPSSNEFGNTTRKAIEYLLAYCKNHKVEEIHPVVLWSLAKAFGMTQAPKLMPPCRRIVYYLIKSQLPDGGWEREKNSFSFVSPNNRRLDDTAWTLAAFKEVYASGIEVDKLIQTMETAIEPLKINHACPNGGFSWSSTNKQADLTATSTVIGVLLSLGERDGVLFKNGLQWYLNNYTKSWADPKMHQDYYSHFWGTRANLSLGDRAVWQNWNKKVLGNVISANKNHEGYWMGKNKYFIPKNMIQHDNQLLSTALNTPSTTQIYTTFGGGPAKRFPINAAQEIIYGKNELIRQIRLYLQQNGYNVDKISVGPDASKALFDEDIDF